MFRFFQLFIVLLSLLVLASCAPTLMSEDRFPIKTKETWVVSYTGTPKVSEEFSLAGKPYKEANYVAYTGSSGDYDLTAIYTTNNVLLIILDLDNKPENERKRLHCLLINDYRNGSVGQQNFKLWSGNGFVGTDKEYAALPPNTMSTLYYTTTCSVSPK